MTIHRIESSHGFLYSAPVNASKITELNSFLRSPHSGS